MTTVVFLYYKNKKLKVLDHYESKMKHTKLLEAGYKHVGTLNSAIFIEYLFNNRESDIKKEIRALCKI